MEKFNPVFTKDRQWYFWDEAGSDYFGPYETEEKAQAVLNEYLKSLGLKDDDDEFFKSITQST